MQSAKLFEEKIRETLLETGEQVAASDFLKHRIHNEITNQTKEKYFMKKTYFKKIALIAVAVICVSSVGAYAAGKLHSYVSHSSPGTIMTQLPSDKELNKDLGFVPKTADAFTNGFVFKDANISETEGLDENGNTLEQFNEISYRYISNDGQEISLNISKPGIKDEFIPNANAKTTVYNGINLTYEEQNYKFGPAEYQLTDQDKADQESGAVVFSYGSDEVTANLFKYISWTDNGVNYLLMGKDINMAEADFVEMAQEIINQ